MPNRAIIVLSYEELDELGQFLGFDTRSEEVLVENFTRLINRKRDYIATLEMQSILQPTIVRTDVELDFASSSLWRRLKMAWKGEL